MEQCQAINDASLKAKDLVMDYRLSYVIVGLTFVNITLYYIDTKVVTRFPAHKNYSAEINQELGIRFMQLIFGSIVAFFGYLAMLWNRINGCSLHIIYLYFCGGYFLISLDLYEYVRRWPLRPVILGHHIVVFFFALAYLDLNLLPPGDSIDIPDSMILIISNIGLMWVLDIFHVFFRLGMDLSIIERMRKVYLWGSLVKPMTFCIMIYSGMEAILLGSYVGSLPSITLALIYALNSYKSMKFVYMFDCEKYFLAHQKVWTSCSDHDNTVHTKKIIDDNDEWSQC